MTMGQFYLVFTAIPHLVIGIYYPAYKVYVCNAWLILYNYYTIIQYYCVIYMYRSIYITYSLIAFLNKKVIPTSM